MSVIDRNDLHIHSNIKKYYETLKMDQWKGNPRDRDAGVVNTGTGTYYGMTGQSRHLLKTLPLTGLYLLGQFRTTEPRLLTAARTAFAPILNTTIAGKAVKTGLQVLRGAQSMGLVKVGLTNSYADIPITANPLLRVKSIFKSSPDWNHEVRNKYGLHYATTDGGVISANKETTYDHKGMDPYNTFRDLIPVKIGDDNDKNVVQVRGLISGMTDNVSPTWNENQYIGRPDLMMTYAGYKRELSFVLRMAATSELDIKPMYAKINALSRYVLPSVDKISTRFSGNLCKLTIGSYIRKELCAMTGFTITPNEDSMWETHDPDLDYPSLTLTRGPLKQVKDTIERGLAKVSPKKKPTLSPRKRRRRVKDPYVVPRVLDISFSFTVLGNKLLSYDPDQSEGSAVATGHTSRLFDTVTKSDQQRLNQRFKALRAGR